MSFTYRAELSWQYYIPNLGSTTTRYGTNKSLLSFVTTVSTFIICNKTTNVSTVLAPLTLQVSLKAGHSLIKTDP